MSRSDLTVSTPGRGLVDITDDVADAVRASRVEVGIALVFVHHTSASVVITENADPDVRHDLETWMARAVRDGDPSWRHDAEGPDDMSAHIRSVITATSVTIPVRDGRPDLGTWQGVFLYEHRARPHRRRVSVTVIAA